MGRGRGRRVGKAAVIRAGFSPWSRPLSLYESKIVFVFYLHFIGISYVH